MFIHLSSQHFLKLQDIGDFNNYVSVLMLLDDLLCRYDLVPRHPEYLPLGKDPVQAGTPELLSEPMQRYAERISSEALRLNIYHNIQLARMLYSDRENRRVDIADFLAELSLQYSEVIHPAIYPHVVG
ncbi:hypothetical protein [Pseudomonas soli]|uniref:hypothetical protein n=1 Tax=Pseudomonas soli TaxID=1306993 RepID=UPI00380F12F5